MTIKEIIDRSGKSRYQISKEAGVRTGALHNIYHGETPLEMVRVSTLIGLAKSLGYETIDALLKDCNDK